MKDKVDTRTLVLGSLGFICLAYSVLLPRWYISDSSGTGPWMWCDWGVKGLQCSLHAMFLGMSIPLWIGTALALSALLISVLAMRGTNCCGDNCCGDNVQKKLFTGGCLYLLSCLMTLGPVIWASWVLVHARPREVGECLYLAWVSVGLLMAAGVLQRHHYKRYGEDGEPVCETAQQEMVCLKKYERTAGDSVTEPAREDSKRQYV